MTNRQITGLILFGLLAFAALVSGPYPGEGVDRCIITDDQTIRNLWTTSLMHAKGESERVELTKSLVKQAEDLCRMANRPVTPLPTRLEELKQRDKHIPTGD